MLRHGHKPFAVEAPGQMVPSFVVCISASREALDLLLIKHIITGRPLPNHSKLLLDPQPYPSNFLPHAVRQNPDHRMSKNLLTSVELLPRVRTRQHETRPS